MAYKYVLETRYKTIVPCLPDSMSILAWAREYPNMYNVYSAGYITYYNSRALDWFVLRWGTPESSPASPVALG